MTPGTDQPATRRTFAALAVLDRISWVAIVAAMAIMTVTVVAQVFLRYLLSAGIDWSEELARLAFVWAMFLAIPHGIRTGVHVGIDVIVTRFSVQSQARLMRLTALFGATLMALLLVYAVGAFRNSLGDRLPTMPLSVAAYYLPVAIAAGHSLLNCLLLAVYGPKAQIDNSLAQAEEMPA